ncbi:MAG: DeoR/GlpR transcriptional regulator [Propionibacteriaceae bacterium]|nr:DeoR/GlpR transcriptional regulator [Propionibacteriaceae bacterium]
MIGHGEALSGTELPFVRRSWITQLVQESGVVRTMELAETLHVSVETIRRDLAALEREGVLERVHGGAASVGQRLSEEPSFLDRSKLGESAKSRIGLAAAGMIPDGSTVFLDVGTTSLQVARALPQGFRGIVATNSLPVATELASRPQVELLVSGGQLRAGDMAMAGQHAQRLFEELRADVAFLGSGGVHAVSGLTDFHLDEVVVRRVMMRNSAQSWALADSSKFSVIAPYHVADWAGLSGLVTDEEPPAAIRSAVVQAKARIVIAER